jgi:hypothetical protein
MGEEEHGPLDPGTIPTVIDVLAERRKTHGSFRVHSLTTLALEHAFYDGAAEAGKVKADFSSEQQEALHMIFHKLGRIAAGDPDFKDHWVDIAGYAQLVANVL